MSLDLLGEGFDLHCGGMDLRFPHHENERAQAVALGRRFANHWMHNGFVVDAEGEKMSKSLGNVRQPARPARVVRRPRLPDACCCRATTAARCASAATASARRSDALAGLDAFAARTDAVVPTSEPTTPTRRCSSGSVDLMDDDLDTPGATALLFDTVRRANTALDAGDLDAAAPLVAAVREIAGAVRARRSGRPTTCRPRCSERAGELDAARAARDYARADAIRAELQAAGWIVETTATGTTVRR